MALALSLALAVVDLQRLEIHLKIFKIFSESMSSLNETVPNEACTSTYQGGMDAMRQRFSQQGAGADTSEGGAGESRRPSEPDSN